MTDYDKIMTLFFLLETTRACKKIGVWHLQITDYTLV